MILDSLHRKEDTAASNRLYRRTSAIFLFGTPSGVICLLLDWYDQPIALQVTVVVFAIVLGYVASLLYDYRKQRRARKRALYSKSWTTTTTSGDSFPNEDYRRLKKDDDTDLEEAKSDTDYRDGSATKYPRRAPLYAAADKLGDRRPGEQHRRRRVRNALLLHDFSGRSSSRSPTSTPLLAHTAGSGDRCDHRTTTTATTADEAIAWTDARGSVIGSGNGLLSHRRHPQSLLPEVTEMTTTATAIMATTTEMATTVGHEKDPPPSSFSVRALASESAASSSPPPSACHARVRTSDRQLPASEGSSTAPTSARGSGMAVSHQGSNKDEGKRNSDSRSNSRLGRARGGGSIAGRGGGHAGIKKSVGVPSRGSSSRGGSGSGGSGSGSVAMVSLGHNHRTPRRASLPSAAAVTDDRDDSVL